MRIACTKAAIRDAGTAGGYLDMVNDSEIGAPAAYTSRRCAIQ